MNVLWTSMRMFLWMTILTGIIYPLLVTLIAQLTMKQKADGDFISIQDKVVGSKLIAQKFESDKYFWARPSVIDYNPLPSGGSNLGPTNAVLKKAVEERQEKIAKDYQVEKGSIPSELLFSSGSGLDPHISKEAAYFQMNRVAKTRGLENKDLQKIIDDLTITPFFGNAYVNVLLLNKALDEFENPNVR